MDTNTTGQLLHRDLPDCGYASCFWHGRAGKAFRAQCPDGALGSIDLGPVHTPDGQPSAQTLAVRDA